MSDSDIGLITQRCSFNFCHSVSTISLTFVNCFLVILFFVTWF